jgi:hypothetical protein
METKLKILCLFLGLSSLSCTRYEDLTETYYYPQNISSNSFDSMIAFQEDKEYYIRLVDNSEFYFHVDRRSNQSIAGYISDKRPALEIPKTKYQEVKLQQIAHVKVRVFDAPKTILFLAVILGTSILSAVCMLIIIAEPAEKSEKSWMI